MSDFTARDILALKMMDSVFERDFDDEPVEIPAGGFHCLCEMVENEFRVAQRYKEEHNRSDQQATRYAHIALGFAGVALVEFLILMAVLV